MGIFDFLFNKKDNKGSLNNQDDLLSKVEVAPGISMPKVFADHWLSIQKDKVSSISIQANPQDDLTLEQSKLGHYPFMPLDYDYPKDAEGRYMYPMAQINFRETPALEGFPEAGYLQVYISAFDDVYGLDFDYPQSQKNFRVIFFEESAVQAYKADFSFLDDVMSSEMLPVHRPHTLNFSKKEEFVGIGDALYERTCHVDLFKIAEQYPAIKNKLEDELCDNFQTNGHKLGGYAYFTQSDPRGYDGKFKDYVLLLQIDSDNDIMWGDVGVANFFIHPDDLVKKDFTKVMYNWDCC